MNKDTVSTRAEFEVQVPKENWINWLTKSPDVFASQYIGYWGYGHPVKTGWIVVEMDDTESREDLAKRGKEAARYYSDRLPLPKGCHLLDEAMAIKAYIEGIKMKGLDWFAKSDANAYDNALQMAMLGEIKYG